MLRRGKGERKASYQDPTAVSGFDGRGTGFDEPVLPGVQRGGEVLVGRQGGPVQQVRAGGMVEERVAEVHVVQAVRGGFLDDDATFAVIEPRYGDVDVGVGHVVEGWEEWWVFSPGEEVLGS